LLWHHGQHATDMALWMLGVEAPGEVEVTDVAAMVALPDQHLDIPLDLSVLFRTKRDQIATIAMSYNSHLSLYDYVLIGQEATLLISNGVLSNREGVLYDPKQDQSEARNSGLLQNREFVAAIREHRQPAISADAVLPALDVLQRVQDTYDQWAPKARGEKHPTAGVGE
jgi:2-hydroxy-4-carboxymuconate semialdehyde hemiacetal dehydrogenase